MIHILLIGLCVFTLNASAQELSGDDLEDLARPEQVDHFDITELPKGGSVTLPHPAATVVPLHLKVQVASTDKKQLLKISRLEQGAAEGNLIVAIFDSNLPRVKYLNIKAGNHALYHFKNLSTIQLVPQVKKSSNLRSTKLLLESNRPLTVGY
jgi:hypothetical protein